jgi:DNA-binding NtrC family response regulator
MSFPPDSAASTIGLKESDSTAQRVAPYLLVVEGNCSFLRPLPPSGEWLIGRAEDCHLRLSDRTASRHHARLQIDDNGITLFDLGSHNGTRVLGHRIVGSRRLQHGDVIQLCDVTLVLHAQNLTNRPKEFLSTPAFRQRLAEEIERSACYGRPLSLLCLKCEETTDFVRLSLLLLEQARLLDVLTRHDLQVLILLPEASPVDRTQLVESFLEAARKVSPKVRAGLSVFPQDGNDVDSLWLAASTASGLARDGECLLASEASRTEQIGVHEVTIADSAMQRIYALLARLSKSPMPVLIQGETGTGKEIAATALHVWSKRSGRLVALNCAALPETLAESELFGHEKGAFTGAISQKLGLLEQAGQGTLFLDEVGELPLVLQAKLLRALETQTIVRIGGQREWPIDVRVVAATHRDLEADVKQGRFREDLFFRLVAARVMLPPLRDRRREIPLLLRQFLKRAARQIGQATPAFSDASLSLLLSYAWPGNIRELRNVCDYLAATVSEGIVTTADLAPVLRSSSDPAETTKPPPELTAQADLGHAKRPAFRNLEEEIRDLEQRRMLEALAATGGVQNRAAELLGMPIRTFAYKMKQYGLHASVKTNK